MVKLERTNRDRLLYGPTAAKTCCFSLALTIKIPKVLDFTSFIDDKSPDISARKKKRLITIPEDFNFCVHHRKFIAD